MTSVRLMRRLTGSDPLRLRIGESSTFWLPCDYDSRRARFAKSMFCSERLLPGRMTLIPLVVVANRAIGMSLAVIILLFLGLVVVAAKLTAPFIYTLF